MTPLVEFDVASRPVGRRKRVMLPAFLRGFPLSLLHLLDVLQALDVMRSAIAAGAAPANSVEPEKEAVQGRQSPDSRPAKSRPGTGEGDSSGRGGEIPQIQNIHPPWPGPEPPGTGDDAGPELLASLIFQKRRASEEFERKMAGTPEWNSCDPWENHLMARLARREWKYNVVFSPAVRLFYLREGLEDSIARCPPAHEKAKTKRHYRKSLLFDDFHRLLLAADLILYGKVVLTPEEVSRYAFVQPDGDVADNCGRDFVEEYERFIVEKHGFARENAEALMREHNRLHDPPILRGKGHGQQIGTHFEEWNDDPARDGDLAKLREEDPVVDRQLRLYEEGAWKVLHLHLRMAGPSPGNDGEGDDVGTGGGARHSGQNAYPDDSGAASGAAAVSTILSQDHLYHFFWGDQTEAEIIYLLEQLEAVDELLPSDLLPPVDKTLSQQGRTVEAAPAGRLPAELSNQPVDWRPKARATIEIPCAAYPVVPPAARQRHWMTLFETPVVTGMRETRNQTRGDQEPSGDAETRKEPTVQFLRLVNTRTSRKTELVKLLLRHLRVLSKKDFVGLVDPENRPYLKWFLTVKHPDGAPDEYLQEVRDLDNWRRYCVWACGSVAVLLLLLLLVGGVWMMRLFRKSEAIRRRMRARRGGGKEEAVVAPSTPAEIPDAEREGNGQGTTSPTRNNGGSSTAGTPTHTEARTSSTSFFGRIAPLNTSVSSPTEAHTETAASTSFTFAGRIASLNTSTSVSPFTDSHTETGTSFFGRIAPLNTSVSSFTSSASQSHEAEGVSSDALTSVRYDLMR